MENQVSRPIIILHLSPFPTCGGKLDRGEIGNNK
jgi:hypothetical protein